jgi:membrane-bound lytic murein transglycosylase A
VEVSGLGRALSIQCVSQLIAITRQGGSVVWRRLIAGPQFCHFLVVAARWCACRHYFRCAVVLAAIITPLFDLPAQSAHRPTGPKVWRAVRPIAANNALIAEAEPLRLPDSALEPIDWTALDGWQTDDHAAAFATFLTSCRPLLRASQSEVNKRPVASPMALARPMALALTHVCQQALAAGQLTEDQARTFFEHNFRPLRVTKLGDSAGLLTGYYEPIVDGSRVPTGIFKVPIYRRPPDLVPPRYSKGPGFPNRGQSLRRTRNGTLVPYYDRGQILDGALDGRHLEICWIKNQMDALVIQIQGSARIRLEDGAMLHINYDAHNGYPFVPIGRILMQRNIIPRNEMSLDRIREWVRANPQGAEKVLRENKSFVFFRIVGLSDDREPAGRQGKPPDREAVGAQGVPLTPGRSIAVDNALHVYGTPFFIQAYFPVIGEKRTASFDRLVIAQDTGSAIVGPARADVYFGAGDQAGEIAGRLHNLGTFAMLVPREIDPVVAGARMPLPPEKPQFLLLASARTSSPKTPTVLFRTARPRQPDCRACQVAESELGGHARKINANRPWSPQPKPSLGTKSAAIRTSEPMPSLVTVLRVQQSNTRVRLAARPAARPGAVSATAARSAASP